MLAQRGLYRRVFGAVQRFDEDQDAEVCVSYVLRVDVVQALLRVQRLDKGRGEECRLVLDDGHHVGDEDAVLVVQDAGGDALL